MSGICDILVKHVHHVSSDICATVCAVSVTCLVKHIRHLLLGIHGIWQQAGHRACTLLQLPCAAHPEHLFHYPLATILLTKDIVVGACEPCHCLQIPFDIMVASGFVPRKWQSEWFIKAACKQRQLWSQALLLLLLLLLTVLA